MMSKTDATTAVNNNAGRRKGKEGEITAIYFKTKKKEVEQITFSHISLEQKSEYAWPKLGGAKLLSVAKCF